MRSIFLEEVYEIYIDSFGKLPLHEKLRLRMTIEVSYKKNQVLQALRYHFLSKREIRVMIILVNVFALISAFLFYFQKILPLALLTGSFLWFSMMICFWFVLPWIVYKRAATFRDHLIMKFEDDSFSVGTAKGSRSWPWNVLSNYLETPNFFHLYFDTKSFFLVPKDSFINKDAVFEFRQLLKEKIK